MFLTSPSSSVPDGELVHEGLPRVVQALLEAQADAALLGIDVQHHDFDFLRGRNDLAGMDVLLGPGHLGDVHQTFDPRLQLHEGAVVGDVGDAALELGPDRVLGFHAFPRIGLKLLHAEADALGFRVEADDLNRDGLADLQGFRRMVDAAPRDVGDVQQTVHTAQIDERAVIGDVLDDALENLAFLEVGDQFGPGLGAALFEHGAAGHHDVTARAVHLEDLERLGRPQQRGNVANRTDVHLAARQERHGAGEVNREAALDPPEDHAGDAGLIVERLLQQRPGFFALGLFAGQDGFAVLVFHPLKVDFNRVAGLQFDIAAGAAELLEGNTAFRLQADVDKHVVVFDRDDTAFDDGTFQAVAGAERLLEQCGEALHSAKALGSSCCLCH